MFFKKFCTELITGLMKDLVGEAQYINVSTYTPLSGSSYIRLPVELKSPKKRTNQHQKQRSNMFFMVSC